MISWFKCLVIFVVLVTPAASQASDFLGEYGGWDVYQSDDSCYMALEYSGPGNTILAFFKHADGTIFLSASNLNWSVEEDEKYDIAYQLDDSAYSGGTSVGTGGVVRKGFLTKFEPDFEQQFGASRSLRIYLAETLVDQLSLNGSAEALVKVNSCVRSVQNKLAAAQREKERWEHIPEDPFASARSEPSGLQSQPPIPRGNDGRWVSNADYPSASLREGQEGNVAFRLTIGANGRATDCLITNSSGYDELDNATCRNMVRRARFDPATDAAGSPTEGTWESTVNWDIPD